MPDPNALNRWPTCPHPDTCQQGEYCTCRGEMACTSGQDDDPLPPPTRAEQAVLLLVYAASFALIVSLAGYAYGKWVAP